MVSNELFDYVVSIRRQIHEYPEIGFDLPRTVALVKSELDKIGIPYTEKYAPCSVVGFIGNDPAKKTLALRADMDALPVEEKVDLPFKSKIPGCMHACGHDTHTAILLGVAKILKEKEKGLPCNVRLFFQPCEEKEESGAKTMTENGVMEGVDAIVGSHCDTGLFPGELGIHDGWFMAACMPFKIEFIGKTTHATRPQGGVDAIRMAYEAYGALDRAVKEEAGEERYIWNVGVVKGGTAHNVVSDYCELIATFRYFDPEFAKRYLARVEKECNDIADRFGGKVRIEHVVSSNAVFNTPELTKQFRETISKDPELKIVEQPIRMGSEDFNWYLAKAPGFMYHFGIRNEETGCTATGHSNWFKVDEEGMKYDIMAFVDFAMNFR